MTENREGIKAAKLSAVVPTLFAEREMIFRDSQRLELVEVSFVNREKGAT